MKIEAKAWKKEANFGMWEGINLVVPSKRGGGSEMEVNGGGRTGRTPLCQLQRESVREEESVGIRIKKSNRDRVEVRK